MSTFSSPKPYIWCCASGGRLLNLSYSSPYISYAALINLFFLFPFKDNCGVVVGISAVWTSGHFTCVWAHSGSNWLTKALNALPSLLVSNIGGGGIFWSDGPSWYK